MHITFPRALALDEAPLANLVQQVAIHSQTLEGNLINFVQGRTRGLLFQPTNDPNSILLLRNRRNVPERYERVLLADIDIDVNTPQVDLSNSTWIRHPGIPDAFDHQRELALIRDSWAGAFSYSVEDPASNRKGLRNPQVGAVHAVHAHWAITNGQATIVMPTGTGKTETMLSILVSARCQKVLVVAPTDTLRSQLAAKFLSLGIIKDADAGILPNTARTPVVCTLRHFPQSVADVDDLFGRANVVVTTSHIAGQCETAVQERMAEQCDVLFIDEAHHAEAKTWLSFKKAFAAKRILQFTATPFREDGKPLDGDIIFKYPLVRAQQEGYFRPITFDPVNVFNKARIDEAIAEKAIQRLRDEAHLGHVLMARVSDTGRAEEVFQIYARYPEFNPVQLHTGIKSIRERERIREEIISGHARIIVCVDMLGEGFDLPTLKIAAFHDIRKTLAVTLQLAGRFTRARPDLGNATFIANTAEVQVRDELRKLYTRDPDWNVLLPQLADQLIGEQLSLQEFLRGFAATFTSEIPLKTVKPATSAVVYRTRCQDWTPENFRQGIHSVSTCEQVHYALNAAARTMVIVTARRVQLDWTEVEHLFSWEWELYVLFWSQDQNLLFINSSSNSGEYRSLAQAVCGDVELIRGQDVFKTFAGVTRLRLQNVGLTEQLGRNIRYTGRMGADVEGGMTDAQRRRATKSVLSGAGFENGHRTAVGASRKGRIWSHRRGRVDELVEWCRSIGGKLLDRAIDPNQILQGTLEAQIVADRPPVMPIGVDWPEEIYQKPESAWTILVDDAEYSLSELDIQLANQTLAGPIRFAMAGVNVRVEFELQLFQDGENPNYRFARRGQETVQIRRGGEAARVFGCSDWFYDNPPIIWFANGASLEGNSLVPLKAELPPYDRARLRTWNWDGVDIRKESQGVRKDADSIQARVIRELLARNHDIVFDDDNPGEAADVVAIRVVGTFANPTGIEVEFFHCKYSGDANPGRRVDDLYELCGQAQKSTSWAGSHEKRTDLFTHLLRREESRVDGGGPSRFERGDAEVLLAVREISHTWPVSLKIAMVQPGVSSALASNQQLTLIAVTENYLKETFNLPLEIITSA